RFVKWAIIRNCFRDGEFITSSINCSIKSSHSSQPVINMQFSPPNSRPTTPINKKPPKRPLRLANDALNLVDKSDYNDYIRSCIFRPHREQADLAQLVERLIRNQ